MISTQSSIALFSNIIAPRITCSISIACGGNFPMSPLSTEELFIREIGLRLFSIGSIQQI